MSGRVEPQVMERAPMEAEYNDNGCCCECCGKPPLPLPEAQQKAAIEAAGGKGVTLPDGRIIEYFTFGASASEATQTLVEIPGSGGSGWLLTQFETYAAAAKALNVQIISISPPGHGLSTNVKHVKGAKSISSWPQTDLEPVLKAEGVEGSFMVEGTSYGTALAMATAMYFGPERVSKLHIHVPYLPNESGQMGAENYAIPDWQIFAKYLSGPCFCWNSFTCYCLLNCCLGCVLNPKLQAKLEEKKIQTTKKMDKLLEEDMRRSKIYGALMNATVSQNAKWGFDPREIRVGKIMISYNTDDVDVPPGHGEWIANYFTEKLGKENTQVNVESGMGHLSQMPSMMNGDFLRQLLAL